MYKKYRIAGNFCGYKFLRFGKIKEFCGFNFCDSSPRCSSHTHFVNQNNDSLVLHMSALICTYRASMAEYELEATVRGYQRIWPPLFGEELECRRETGNSHDPYARAVIRNSTTVGHAPRRISSLCSSFIGSGGRISCRETKARRRYSSDLPQGGLEVPCVLQFVGTQAEIEKIVKLALAVPSKQCSNKQSSCIETDCCLSKAINVEPPSKRKRKKNEI